MELPPGFRFYPTDEELITHYLSNKIVDCSFSAIAIGEVDMNKVEPWDLPWRAKMGEKEWYFFCVKDKKYPTGSRANRATAAGYWKATGKDKEIFRGKTLVGMKKTLVFYKGRAPKGDQAGAVYVKLANCYLKFDSKHEATNAYADAAHCYKKTNTKESILCLQQSVNLFLDIGRLNMSARYYKPNCMSKKRTWNKLLFTMREPLISSKVKRCPRGSANQCRQKITQFAAQLEQYQKAIEIYEDIGRQSLNNNLLKYGVKGHLLNAGICQLCKGDVVAINNALERYQDLDPTFSGTREYRLLADLAAALDEEDVEKFTGAIKEFDSMTRLDAWKTTLLLRVKEAVKAKELEEDDLT